jgi:hemerythrin superfamily protein
MSTQTARNTTTAVEMLREDHRRLQGFFQDFREISDPTLRRHIVELALTELHLHNTVEEELFFPQLREALKEPGYFREAERDHADVTRQMLAVERLLRIPEADYTDAFRRLAQRVTEHTQREENDVLPRAEGAGFDQVGLGVAMAERRQAILAERPSRPWDAGGEHAIDPRC